MSKTPSDLPDWLRDDEGDASKKKAPRKPSDAASDAPPPASDDDVPSWLRGADAAPARDEYVDESGSLSAAFLAKGDALPDKVDLNYTFDQWSALQKDKARPRDIEEEVPDFSADFSADADPALKQTGQLPDWFLGLEEIDEGEAPEWFMDSKPKVTGALPPTPPPVAAMPDDVAPWLAGLDAPAVPPTGGLAALEPLEDDLFADMSAPPPVERPRGGQTEELPDFGWMINAAANVSASVPHEPTPSMDDLMARMVSGVEDYDAARDSSGDDDAPDMARILADIAQDDGSPESDARYGNDLPLMDLPATGMFDDYDNADMPRFDTAMLRSMIPGAPKFAKQPPAPKPTPEPPPVRDEPPPPSQSGATALLDAEPEFDWLVDPDAARALEPDDEPAFPISPDTGMLDQQQSDQRELDASASAWLGELEDIVGFAVQSAGQQTQKLPTLDENLESWGFGTEDAAAVPELDDEAFDFAAFDRSAVGTTGMLPEARASDTDDDFVFAEIEEALIPGLNDPEPEEETFDWLLSAGTIEPEPPAAVTESRSRLTGMLTRFNQPEPEPTPDLPAASDDDDDLFAELDLDKLDLTGSPAATNNSLIGAWTLDDVSDEDVFQPPEMPDLGFELFDAENDDLFGDLEHEIRREPSAPADPMDWESVVRSRSLQNNEIIFETPDPSADAPSKPSLFGEAHYDTDDLDSSLDVESLMEEGAALDLSTPDLSILPKRTDDIDMSWLRDDLFGHDSDIDSDDAEVATDADADDTDAEIAAFNPDWQPTDVASLMRAAPTDSDAEIDWRAERYTTNADAAAPTDSDADADDLFSLFERAQAQQTAENEAESLADELPALNDLTWERYAPAYTPSDVDKIDTGALRPPPDENEDVTWMLDAFGDEVEVPAEPAVDWLTNDISEVDSSSNMFEPDMLALAGSPETIADDAVGDETIAFESQMPALPTMSDDSAYGAPTTFDFFAEPPAPQTTDDPAWLQDLSDLEPEIAAINDEPRAAFALPLDSTADIADELPDDLDVLFGGDQAALEAAYEPEYEGGDGTFSEADLLSDASIRDLDAYLSGLQADEAPELRANTASMMARTDIDLDEVLGDEYAPAVRVTTPSDIAPANIDWLNQLQTSVTDVSAGALLRQMQDKPVEDLPDRMQKLRDLGENLPGDKPATGDDPLMALLPGVADALPPAPTSILIAPSLTGAPALTPEQERGVLLLRSLAATRDGATGVKPRKLSAIELTYDSPYMEGLEDTETALVERDAVPEPEPTPAPRRRRRVTARGTLGMSIERIIIVAILAAAVVLPFLMPAFRAGTLPPTAFAPGGAAAAVYAAIEALPPGALVLIGIEYSTGSAGELDGLTDSILRHLFLRGAIPVIIGGNPIGVLHTANLLEALAADRAFTRRIGVTGGLQANRDYYLVRYLPGSALGLRAFSGDSAALLLTDINGQATGLRVRSLQDFSLIALVADRAEDVRAYAEQVAPLAQQPIIAAVSYSAAPLVEPYFVDSATMRGLLVGYGDGYTYSGLIGGVTPFSRADRPIQPLLVGPTATPTPTITPTFTPSRTPSPTRDPDASNTPTYTPSPPPTPTTAPLIGVVSSSGTINVRSGAGTTFDVVTTLAPGAQVIILGANAGNDWLNVRTEEGVEGWVSSSLLRVEQRTSDARKEGSLLKPFRQENDVEPTATRPLRTSAPSASPPGFVASLTPIPTRQPSATNTRTPVPSATRIPSRTPTQPEGEVTLEPTNTRTPVPSATRISSRTPTQPQGEVTLEPTNTRTPVPSATVTPLRTLTALALSLTAFAASTNTPELTDAPSETPPPPRTMTALVLSLTAVAEQTGTPTLSGTESRRTGQATSTRTPSRAVTSEATDAVGAADGEVTPEVTAEPGPDIGATLGAAFDDFSAGLTIDETPSAGYRDERWYATTGGIIASALIIAFGALINVVRGIFRLGRTRTTTTRRRR